MLYTRGDIGYTFLNKIATKIVLKDKEDHIVLILILLVGPKRSVIHMSCNSLGRSLHRFGKI